MPPTDAAFHAFANYYNGVRSNIIGHVYPSRLTTARELRPRAHTFDQTNKLGAASSIYVRRIDSFVFRGSSSPRNINVDSRVHVRVVKSRDERGENETFRRSWVRTTCCFFFYNRLDLGNAIRKRGASPRQSL